MGMEKPPARTSPRRKRHATFEKLEHRQMMSVALATSTAPLAAPSGSAKLTGATIGTAGSYNNLGNTIAKAFDGSVSTYFDAPSINGGWAGLDLGVAERVTQVQYVPRVGWTGRMTGGLFQGSNTPDFSAGVATLFTVTSAPATGVFTAAPVTASGMFRYVRYMAPTGGYGNVAELEFDGTAAPVPVAAAPTAVAATASPTGVHLTWAGDPSTSIDSFTLLRQGPTDAGYVTLATVTGTTFDDATALASTAYSYEVVANNATGVSAPSTAVSVTMPAPVANPWIDADIGAPANAGAATAGTGGTVTVSGGGADIWNATDQFNYQYQSLTGNGTVVAQVTSQTNTNAWAKSGIMIRESAGAESRFVLLALTPGNGVTLQARAIAHATPAIVTGTVGAAGVWLKLTRSGNAFTASTSADGVTWKTLGSVTVTMASNALAGLAVTAHDNTKLSTATFANVSTTSATPVAPPAVVPAAPTAVTATASTAGIQLAWTADPSGASASFTVSRKGPSDAGYIVLGTVTSTAYADATAAPSTTYSYVVVANNSAGASPTSTAVSATMPTPVVVPAAPTAVAATATAAGVQLAWTADPSGASTSFTVERQGPTDAGYVVLATVTGTTYADATAVASTTYSYVIVANDSAGTSPASTAASATMPTPVVVPAAPTAVTATATAAGVQLAWVADPSGASTSFTVERQGPTDAGYLVLGTVTGTSYADATAAASTTYSYVILANDSAGASPASTALSVMMPTPIVVPVVVVPAAPTALTATASAAGVQLAWTADPSGASTSFTVERQGPADAGYVVLATVTGTTYADATAAASTTYGYVIVANNTAGASKASTSVSVATPAPVVVTPVANPWTDADIGGPAYAGGAVVSPSGTITVSGGGADIWNTGDQFNYQSQSLVGNGSIVAQVTAQTNTNGWAKAGIMVRESTNADSRFVLLALTPGYGVTLQARSATHFIPSIVAGATGTAGVWLKLTRSGSLFTAYTSTDGVTWATVGSATVTMVNDVTAGLAVTAHDNTKRSTATFANVTVASGVQASEWSNGAAGPLVRWEAQNFTYNGKMYLFGGFTDHNYDATSEGDVYDPTTNTWTTITTIPVAGGLTHSAVRVVGDTVYFAGGDVGTFTHGLTSTTGTNQVLSYNITTNTWGATTPLPVAGSCGGLVCINNHLIYYGGLNAGDTADLSNTWSLDLANPAAGWVAKAAMPNPRNHIGAAAINGIAYAIGGQHLYAGNNNVAEVDAYNPVTDTWTRVASLPMPVSSIGVSTIVVNGKILVVGGQTNGGYNHTYLNTILSYDPTANGWTQVGTMPEPNQSLAVGYVNGQLIVATGSVDSNGYGWAQNWTWVDSSLPLGPAAAAVS
jgi:N-acetylneuraminic acid mutarotase/fibronectin type 3 domain-containing protein